ncbi:MAG: transcription-repair coupling factor [Clostridia bacterium]|nr:transcription-repair coupling factor [Clostridia bacterium]
MSNILCDLLKHENEYVEIINSHHENQRAIHKYPMMVTGLCEGALNAFLASLACDESPNKTSLVLVSDEKTALRIVTSLNGYGLRADVYPAREPVVINMVSSRDIEQIRISVLRKIIHGELDVVVALCDASIQYTIPKASLVESELYLEVGSKYSIENIRTYLLKKGYTYCELVDGKGQFSVRGEIIDIFPTNEEQPYRVVFFDDEIETIDKFDLFTQRRIEKVKKLVLTTARELILDSEARDRVISTVKSLAKKADENGKEVLNNELFELENNAEVNFLDKYLFSVYENPSTLLDYFDESTLLFVIETSNVADRLKSWEFRQNELCEELIHRGIPMPKNMSFSKNLADLYSFVDSNNAIIVNSFESKYVGKLSGIYSFKTRIPPAYTGNFSSFSDDLRMYTLSGDSVLLLCSSDSEGEALEEKIKEAGMDGKYISKYSNVSLIEHGKIVISQLNVSGFELINRGFICISLSEKNSMRESSYKRRTHSKVSAKEKLMSYADLQVGDLVVHDVHGIGRFAGIESVLSYDKIRSDHIKLIYANNTVLYIPCDRVDMLSKYIGADSDNPNAKLSNIGTRDWTRAKQKVKKEVQEMAKELSLLYAERLRKPGFAFEPDDDLQREFELSFEYVETDGQLSATADIKRDMEKPYPMDRLLCGDVGFGKTEVALRAAFKAVDNNKQVAILVPTTILALQHYQTVCTRMRKYPIRIEMLSRFVPKSKRDSIARAVARGDVDIVIGTHSILGENVQFKDLGLVIIDEEQRFGVAQKEKLKAKVKNVDVLTLSATPIPRTLNMAMSDIRDMSILDEAPVDRLPVQTYVLEYDTSLIIDAIRRELQRAGQVFYLHNDIYSIYAKANQIQEEFPDAVIRVAHGQMDKEELSDIWKELVDGSIDVLVCTTIIETGVDVPNANTLIIDNADKMGLAQLHQIRGRVGRSSRRAYAYFTYAPGKSLTDIQTKRLQAIRDYTEFGAGFKIALRDLEIRGAGDVLGAKQSGHMETVGYDMYVKILNEVLLEEKGTVPVKKPECVITINRDAYVPTDYVTSETQRIDIYKKISHITSVEDANDVIDELTDRYGKIPVTVQSLINASLMRAIGPQCGFTKIEGKGIDAIIHLSKLDFVRWSKVSDAYPNCIVIIPSASPTILCHNKNKEQPQDFVCKILKEYSLSGAEEDN